MSDCLTLRGEYFQTGTSVSWTRLLIKGVIVEGTRNGSFIGVAITGTKLLSNDTDGPLVTLPLPPSTFPVVQSTMVKRFQAKVVSSLLSWVSSSIQFDLHREHRDGCVVPTADHFLH